MGEERAFSDEITEVVTLARRGSYGASAARFNRLLLSFQSHLEKRIPSVAAQAELTTILGSLFEAQQQADWVRFADVLEYELSPLWARLGTG